MTKDGKKYELTDKTCVVSDDGGNEITLYRIRALRDFGDARKVKAGEIGGFVESEFNLLQDGGCWVAGNAAVYGGAQVVNDAWVMQDARVHGDVMVCDHAEVTGDAVLDTECVIRDYAYIWKRGHMRVTGSREKAETRVGSDVPEDGLRNPANNDGNEVKAKRFSELSDTELIDDYKGLCEGMSEALIYPFGEGFNKKGEAGFDNALEYWSEILAVRAEWKRRHPENK